MAVCQNLVPLVNIKIAGKWMFIPLKMVLIGIDPYPCGSETNVNDWDITWHTEEIQAKVQALGEALTEGRAWAAWAAWAG